MKGEVKAKMNSKRAAQIKRVGADQTEYETKLRQILVTIKKNMKELEKYGDDFSSIKADLQLTEDVL